MISKRIIGFLIFITVLSGSLFYSCSDNPVDPYANLEPGRRDYKWSVDTLNSPGNMLEKIWGSSSTDVWIIGSGYNFDKTLWHYDGNKWTTDGKYRSLEPWCVYGFANNDVWVAGADGKIWHFDGLNWEENLFYKKDIYNEYPVIIFYDIWGSSPDNIFAVGFLYDNNSVFYGLIMHYNGSEWKKIDVDLPSGSIFKIRKGIKTGNNYFLYNLDQNVYPADSVRYLKYDGNNGIETIHHDINGRTFDHNITIINDEVLLTINDGLYTYSNSKFNLILKNTNSSHYPAVYGRNRKDLFWTMADGLMHYNGSNLKYILEFNEFKLNESSIMIRDGAVFENEVFFVTNGNGTNYVFHGKLKNNGIIKLNEKNSDSVSTIMSCMPVD